MLQIAMQPPLDITTHCTTFQTLTSVSLLKPIKLRRKEVKMPGFGKMRWMPYPGASSVRVLILATIYQ